MQIKKSKMPRSWPIQRKSNKSRYIAVPSHSLNKSISILFVLRNIFKLASTRKEVRHILAEGQVKINNIVKKDENSPIQIFDTISLEKLKKFYRLEIVNRKFYLSEIKKSETNKKISKILGKTILRKNLSQMNLEDGTNILTKLKFNVGDSIILNTKEKTIEKVLPLKLKAKIEIVLGKHAGEKGELVAIEDLRRGKTYKVKLEDREVSLPYKTILVIN